MSLYTLTIEVRPGDLVKVRHHHHGTGWLRVVDRTLGGDLVVGPPRGRHFNGANVAPRHVVEWRAGPRPVVDGVRIVVGDDRD